MEVAPREVTAAWLAAMRRGDWAEAWRQTDRIELPRRARQAAGSFVRAPHHLRWDGTPFAGRRVLVRCEHGLGDTLQFARFLPQLVQLAREVHLLVQPPLLGLLAGAPRLGTVRNGWTGGPAPAHDVEVEVMELAYAFRATPHTVPPPYPHLGELAAGKLRFEWPRDGKLRVGLLWAVSHWGHSRSIPPELLEPLLRVEGARFFSLQQGPDQEALPADWPVTRLSGQTSDIVMAAAAMLELDLVICVDAMAAHLAGMLGRPTWLLLQHQADWRWMDERSDSPWYPTARLFRQPAPGDWAGAVAKVAAALREWRTRHSRAGS